MTLLTRDTKVEIFAANDWIDISNRCRAGHTHKFVTKHGHHGQAGVIPEPADCEIVTAQNDGYLWPDNPMGALFGYLDLNTPMRMAMPFMSETFTTTVVDSWPTVSVLGQSLAPTNTGLGGSVLATDFQVSGGVGTHSVPTTSAYRQTIYGGLFITDCKQGIDFRLPTANVTGGAIEPANLLFRTGADGYLMLRVTVNTDETITLEYRVTDDTGSDLAGTDVINTGIVNTGQWLRVIGNVEDARVQAKVFARDDPEPFEWQLDDGEMLEHRDVEEFAPWAVFAFNAGGIGNRTGVASGNSNTKPIVVEYDNWTVESVRFHGEISDYPMVIAPGTKDRATPLRGAGILQRYTQGNQPTISALTRTIPFLPGVVEYWPLEDESGHFGSGLSGRFPMIPQRGTPGYTQFSTLKSSKPLPKGNGADWVGQVVPYTFTGKIQIGFVVDLPIAGQSDRSIMCRFYTDHPSAKLWNIVYRTGGDLELQAWTSELTSVYISSVVNTNMDGGTWYVEFSLQNVGANVEWTVVVRKLEAAGEQTSAGTFTATGLQLQAVSKIWMNLQLQTTTAYGHLVLSNEISDINTFLDLLDAMDAFVGDATATRFKRIMEQNDIIGTPTRFVDPIGTPPNQMGPQKPLSTLDILRQIVELDTGGVLYDARTHPGIMFRRRSGLYNQTPKLTLSYEGNQISSPFSPKTNTKKIRNRVAVSRIDGGKAIYEKTTGRKSVLSPGKGGSGKYETEIAVNARSDVLLPQLAAFRVAMVTANGARYPRVTVDLNNSAVVADSTIMWSLLDLRPGDIVEITDAEKLFAYDTIRLIVRGYTETITQLEHKFELDCEPADAYFIYEVEHDTLGRHDSSSSTLSAALDDNDLTFNVQSTAELWTEDGTKFPFDIDLNGERVELSGISTPLPSFVAVGAAAHADSASVAPALPGGGTTTGDTLMLVTACRNTSIPSNIPADWENIGTLGSIRVMIAPHGTAAPTVTWTGTAAGDTCSAVIMSFRNLGSFHTHNYAVNGSAQNIAYNGLSSFIAKSIVIFIARKSDDWVGVPPVAGVSGSTFTEIADISTTVGNDQALSLQYLVFNGQTNKHGGLVGVPGGTLAVTGGGAAVSEVWTLLFGSWQTFTASERSKNNVVKSHAAGTEVHMFRTGQFGV